MNQPLPGVLIVDDDPDHLKIYGWILEQAGLNPFPCLAGRKGLDLPQHETVAVVVLDYALHCALTPEEVAKQVQSQYPKAPIVLLSDVYGMPEDIAPFVAEFVRKGNPQKLVTTVQGLIKAKLSLANS